MLEVDDARLAALVLTADDPDAHSGTDELQEPSRRHHLDGRHTQRQPRIAHPRRRFRVLAGDRDAGGGPTSPDRRD
jgi:hypothetical protein